MTEQWTPPKCPHIDAIHTCTDLAECQVQAALLAVDEYTARHSTAPVVQDIEHGTEPSLSDVRQVLNRINRHSAADVARMVRRQRVTSLYPRGDITALRPGRRNRR